MEAGMYTVTGVLAYHPVAESLGVALDHPADDIDLASRPDSLDCAFQRLAGALGQQPRFFVDLAAEECAAVVSMDSVDVGGDVYLHQVAVLQWPCVRDAVADHLVDRRAARLREAPVTQRRGVGVMIKKELVDHAIQFVSGHAG